MSGRQYFYKMNGCPAENSNSPECICWHDDGTGPMLSWPTSYGPTDWRDKPIAPTQGADGESLRPVATLGLAIAKDQARMLEQWAEESRVSDPQQWNDMLMIARNLVELATRDAARGAAAPTAPNTGSVAAFDLIDVTPGAKEDIAYACRPNFYNGPGLTHDRLTEIRAYIEKRIPESRDEVPFTINSETLLQLTDNILHYDDRALLATRDATPADHSVPVAETDAEYRARIESAGWEYRIKGFLDRKGTSWIACTGKQASEFSEREGYDVRPARGNGESS